MKEKILVLGGTEFVGRLLVEALKADETKEIFLFNRGKTNPALFPEVHRILGDRETNDIEKIQAHHWDYVIDFSSYYPKSLQKTIDQINRDVKKYVYISTVALYDLEDYDFQSKIKEDYKKVTYSAEEEVDQTMRTYGKKKMACEDILQKASWLNTIILRPSIIYGKYDPTDRFYYWLRKIKMAKEIIIPNDGEDKLTLTYANDLVLIVLNAIDGKLPNGVYNCNTHELISFREMLGMMKKLLGAKNEWYGMDVKELRKEKVWMPLSYMSNLRICNSKIKEVLPLEFTSFEDSVKAVIKYCETENWRPCRIGIQEEREKELIKKDKSNSGKSD